MFFCFKVVNILIPLKFKMKSMVIFKKCILRVLFLSADSAAPKNILSEKEALDCVLGNTLQHAIILFKPPLAGLFAHS